MMDIATETPNFRSALLSGGRAFGQTRNVNDAMAQTARRMALQRSMGKLGSLSSQMEFEAQQPGFLDYLSSGISGLGGVMGAMQSRKQGQAQTDALTQQNKLFEQMLSSY